ncbi:MAG: Wzz/FepE/Etk N-terminal domain-containing protein [Clostridia bacterium]|nr:Wzz/FepE/Etk N-terminal domain-containing protein [Clostridia bacterium]
MGTKRLLKGFSRRLWLVATLAAVGSILAGFFSIVFYIPEYEAESTVLAINRDKTSLTGEALNYQDFMMSQQFIKNYGEIINSTKVTSTAIKELRNYSLSAQQLNKMVSISFKKDSNVIAVKAIAKDPQMAAAVANAVSRAYVSKVRELVNSETISILDEAAIPESPIPSDNTKKILIGFLAGLAISFGIIYILELFDTTVRSAEDIEHNLKLCVIGIIPEHDIR